MTLPVYLRTENGSYNTNSQILAKDFLQMVHTLCGLHPMCAIVRLYDCTTPPLVLLARIRAPIPKSVSSEQLSIAICILRSLTHFS